MTSHSYTARSAFLRLSDQRSAPLFGNRHRVPDRPQLARSSPKYTREIRCRMQPACKHQHQHVGRLYALIIQPHSCGALHHHGKPSVTVRRRAPESCGKDNRFRVTSRVYPHPLPQLQNSSIASGTGAPSRSSTLAANFDRSGLVQRKRRRSLDQVFKPDPEVRPDRL